MSGIDEISRFAPECPKCGRCNEWYMGGQHWMLTRESMENRGLRHALICYRNDGPADYALSSIYKCISCSHEAPHDSHLGQLLYNSFMSQRGGFYHTLAGTTSEDERKMWEK